MNTYQDRVQVIQYKFTKTSEWMDARDALASSVQVRFREKEPAEPDKETEVDTEEPDTEEVGTEESGTTEPTEPEEEKPDVNRPDDSQGATEFIYEINSEGSAITITKCISSDTDIVIPSSIDGYVVAEICANAFENVTSMRTVTFPDSLTTIGDYAFAGCTSLASVTLPDTLTSLGRYVFKDCSSLTSAVLNRGRKTITVGLFYGCALLSDVTIPDTAICIAEDAFRGCMALRELDLPKSLFLINKNAFLNSGIASVHYTGTSKDWRNISIYAEGNTVFLNATVTGLNGKSFSADKRKWNAGGSSAGSASIPYVSKVYSLKAKAGRKKLKISWKKVSGAAGYQVELDKTKYFFGPKTITVSGSRKAVVKKGLKAKKKYYVRIRAYKTYRDARGYTQRAYGPWSRVSKKTK